MPKETVQTQKHKAANAATIDFLLIIQLLHVSFSTNLPFDWGIETGHFARLVARNLFNATPAVTSA